MVDLTVISNYFKLDLTKLSIIVCFCLNYAQACEFRLDLHYPSQKLLFTNQCKILKTLFVLSS